MKGTGSLLWDGELGVIILIIHLLTDQQGYHFSLIRYAID